MNVRFCPEIEESRPYQKTERVSGFDNIPYCNGGFYMENFNMPSNVFTALQEDNVVKA
ncbi:MAG: hypothetical protein ACPLKQ_05685 [Candidatus Bathyarchaeales archaeon]